ncbi:MAG: phosphoribosylamine--glycine ligase [Planctomycetota bacterium]|jgi:phosphoribosylamine--glycine ligase
MKVMVVGSGGREHSIVHSIVQSPLITKCYCAPGNGGTAREAENVAISAEDVTELLAFARDKSIDLTIVGPEAPLVKGIVGAFEDAGLRIFGPTAGAAELEGSKAFAKELMRKHRIPTGPFRTFNSADEALAYVENLRSFPTVVKADGLAAGKGVIVAQNREAAENAVRQIMLDRVFGSAGDRLVIEDFLRGTEASVFLIVDGKTLTILESARDHKQVFDGGNGPNTGGMGAYSPARIVTGKVYSQVEDQILVPTVHAMEREGRPFRGILYCGLMITKTGPRVLEYNARGGDPEMQVLLPRLRTDFLAIANATAEGSLEEIGIFDWDPRACVCVVMASGGYPGSYKTGHPITGIEEAEAMEDVTVIHAGTAEEDGKIVTAGGRVLNVVAMGDNLEAARKRAYEAVEKIHFEGCHYRKDIGSYGVSR